MYPDQEDDMDDFQCLCAFRGLLMLLHIEHLKDAAWTEVTFRILNQMNEIFTYEKKAKMILTQFLVNMNKEQFTQYLGFAQSILCYQIIQGDKGTQGEIDMELLEEVVRLMHWFHVANDLRAEKLDPKDFHNNEINNSVDLTAQMQDWSDYVLEALSKDEPVEYPIDEEFNLCAFNWILNTHSKS